MASILIAGCGDLGCGVAQALVVSGHQVSAIRRTGTVFPDAVNGITGAIERLEDEQLPNCDVLLIIMTPQGRTEASYQQTYLDTAVRLSQRYQQQPYPPKVFFVSSTSVYGQDKGEWVTHLSSAEPTSATAKILVASEHQLSQSLDCTSVRFSGIYGPGRLRLVDTVLAGLPWSDNQWSNRIHRDDCVRLLTQLIYWHLEGKPLDKHYIATDSTPVSLWEVKLWIASYLQCPIKLPQDSQAFIPVSGKRLDNRAILDLGFELKYPSYALGYRDMLEGYGR